MDESTLAVLIAFLVVTISPGPANIAAATVAMQYGRRRGLQFAFGLATGLAVWGIVAATGLGVVLQASATALLVLKLFGASYLLWLAYHSARAAASPTQQDKKALSEGRWYIRGLLLNLSNPKAVVAWMAALSVGLGADDGLLQLAAITCFCMLIGVGNYVGHAFTFSISGVMDRYAKARRWIDGAVAGLFATAGFGLLKSAFGR